MAGFGAGETGRSARPRKAVCTYKQAERKRILEGVKVTEVMSRPVITITPETRVKAAAQLLVEHGISALPVVDRDGRLVGIVSEADLVPIEARPVQSSQSRPLAPTAGSTPRTAADVMTRDVITVRAEAEVSQAARRMLEAGVKRVPVVRGRRVIGIVSRRDLVRVIAREDREVRAELAHRLVEAGFDGPVSAMTVKSGVATIELQETGPERRLAEAVARDVPGVLEVRFAKPGR